MKDQQSMILQTSTRYLKYMLLFFSVYLLLRGHNEPGGGFVGGLMAASAFILYAIAFNVNEARAKIKWEPQTFIAFGLLCAVFSGILSLLAGDAFMTGEWEKFYLPFHIKLKIGTPLLFDIGVYLVVFGVTLNMIFALLEE